MRLLVSLSTERHLRDFQLLNREVCNARVACDSATLFGPERNDGADDGGFARQLNTEDEPLDVLAGRRHLKTDVLTVLGLRGHPRHKTAYPCVEVA